MGNKSLSQYFLIKKKIADKIAQAVVNKGNGKGEVLEIGGGKGILTRPLAENGFTVITVEIDGYLAEYIKKQFNNDNSVSVINTDILKLDLDNLFDGREVSLCGNIPYHLSGKIFRWISDNRRFFPKAVLMVQEEVGLRICTEPGNRDYGILSVILGVDYKSEFLFPVNRKYFNPAPKVTSAVIRLIRLPHPLIADDERIGFFEFVKTSFSQRRKKIYNCLRGYMGWDMQKITNTMVEIGIDISSRPEDISVPKYIELYHNLL